MRRSHNAKGQGQNRKSLYSSLRGRAIDGAGQLALRCHGDLSCEFSNLDGAICERRSRGGNLTGLNCSKKVQSSLDFSREERVTNSDASPTPRGLAVITVSEFRQTNKTLDDRGRSANGGGNLPGLNKARAAGGSRAGCRASSCMQHKCACD